MSYKTTPSLKIEMLLYPRRSVCVCFPLAISITNSKRRFADSSIVSPETIEPASKSIQLFLFSASWLFVESFNVGAGAPNGVPRPVVNKIMCAPAAVIAVAD